MNAIYQWLDQPGNAMLAVTIIVLLVMALDALVPVRKRRQRK